MVWHGKAGDGEYRMDCDSAPFICLWRPSTGLPSTGLHKQIEGAESQFVTHKPFFTHHLQLSIGWMTIQILVITKEIL